MLINQKSSEQGDGHEAPWISYPAHCVWAMKLICMLWLGVRLHPIVFRVDTRYSLISLIRTIAVPTYFPGRVQSYFHPFPLVSVGTHISLGTNPSILAAAHLLSGVSFFPCSTFSPFKLGLDMALS